MYVNSLKLLIKDWLKLKRDFYNRNLDCVMANYPNYDEKEKCDFLWPALMGSNIKDVNE